VKGCCEQGDGSSGSIKTTEFLEKLLTSEEGLCFIHG
jgi:hypothetical protein